MKFGIDLSPRKWPDGFKGTLSSLVSGWVINGNDQILTNGSWREVLSWFLGKFFLSSNRAPQEAILLVGVNEKTHSWLLGSWIITSRTFLLGMAEGCRMTEAGRVERWKETWTGWFLWTSELPLTNYIFLGLSPFELSWVLGYLELNAYQGINIEYVEPQWVGSGWSLRVLVLVLCYPFGF